MWWRKTATAQPANLPARSALAVALEPRMLFDGAVAATVAETADAQPTADASHDQASVENAHSSADNLAATPTGTTDNRREVVFIDNQVKDYQQLISGLKPGSEVVVLDGSKDGLQQIADYLNGRSGIDAIHIISHGDVGKVQLGNSWLDSNDLANRSATLSAIGQALDSEGDILLYGCLIGADGAGRNFIDGLANATGADVAASDDLTGAASKGGDWVLEVNQGDIETEILDLASYGNILAAFSDNFSDASAVNGVTSFTRTLGGVSYTFTFTSDGDGGDFAWENINGSNNSASINMLSAGGTSAVERITITRTDGQDFTFSSIFIDNASGGITNVRGYLDGVAVGTNQTMNQGNSGVLSFGNLRVDQVQITSTDFFGTNFDDFTGDTTPPNAAPTISNLNGDSVAWSGVGNTVRLDVGSNASLADAELGALNGGNGNWSGASLVIQRNGTAVSSDVLDFDTSGALFTVDGSNLQANGQTFATFTSVNGVLTITFTSSTTTATTALVNDVAQRITYRNDTPAGDANMRYTLTDGAGGSVVANLTVASDTIYVTNTGDTATIDVSNGVSFSEAVAIAAADVTGSQTIVFASNLAGQTLNLNVVSINESLTFDMDQVSGLTLTGGTITLAGGTTQTFSNGSGDTASIVSVVAGSGALTKTGAGNLTLSGAANSFSGATTISAGTLTVAGGNALSDSSSVAIAAGATLALSSSEAIGNLSGAGAINLGSSTLTTTQTADTTFSGNISGTGGLAISQGGAATYALTLSGNNTYTGATILTNYGWLKLDGEASMANGSAVQVNGNSVLTLLSDQTVGSLASNNANASIQLGSYALTAGGDNTTTSVLGVISGTGSLVKQGGGTLTLSGSNTYGGTTTVSAGTLSISGDGNLGGGAVNLAGGTVLDVSGATNIDNAIVLTGNSSIGNSNAVTLSGAISGAYDLTKTGSGTLTLSGSNSYGATYVSAGTLSVSSDGNLGSGAVNLAAGTTLALTGATTVDNAIVLAGDAAVSTAANATLSGVISGGFTLTKAGANSLTLSGSNTYGATTVSAGTLSVASDSNLGSGTLTLASGSTLAVTSATTIDNAIALSGSATVNTGADTTLSGVISGSNNLTKAGSAVLTLSGNNTYSGTTSVSAGTLSVASDANLGAGSLNLANGTTLQITGNTTIDNALALTGVATINAGAAATLSGVISGSGGLTKSGSGSLTLSASNTNLGNTSVAAGTLVVDGSTSSATTVASGSTLAGSGTLGGDVTVQNGGTLSPGNSGAGTLTVNGNLTLDFGSTLALDINGASAGTGYDRVVVNGNVDVSGATLAVTHGYVAGSGDSYTVIVNDVADAVVGTFSGISEGGKFNAAGNGTELTTSYIGGDGNDLTLTAPIAPTITSVSSSTANGTYKIGDVIIVNVQFDSAVNVTGTPTLTLETGATDRVLDYVSGSGSNTLSFSYTVQAGDSSADLDYVSTSALSLNGGTIRDGANQSAILTLATPGAAGSLGANKALVVDGVRPAATSITLSDTTLGIGETATVTITFNEAVLGLDVGDFNVANGSLSNPSSSDGGLTWTATFTPSTTITDASNIITLNNAGVMDQAGNLGSGTTESGNYAIDTQRPTATIVVSDTALAAGETATVTITFSEAVTGLTTTDFSVANGTLSNLSTSDNITWTATLTPSANVTDTTNLITLDNTGYSDAAGNTGTGTTDSNNYAIDTQRPTAGIVITDTALKAGQSTTVTITFSEAVTGLTTADFSVANGTLGNLSSSDGGITWTATLTPDADVTDATNLITLDNTGYTDAAGNTGTGTTDSNNYAIDSKAPAITSVGVPANGTYVAGDALDFTVNFDEAVTVDTAGGTPRLAITLDTGGTVYANYLSGSGSTALVFRLTVANGQQDSNGIAIGTSLQSNGATLRDAAGNDTQTALNNVPSTANVLVDAAPPQVTGIALDGTSPTTNTTLGFTVTFSEDVNGVDLTDFALATTGSANGTLLSLVQIDARTYRITVGGVTGQGTLGLSLTAAGSGIVDAVGNAMQSNFSSAGYTLGGLNTGDPEFRANPTPNVPTTPTAPAQPSVPGAPPSSTTSPLLPPPLFEQPTLGSGVPTVGNIFINNGALAPSFIAQVFASSDSGAGNGSGIGFLGFGGGDGGVFGTSSFSSMFNKDVPLESGEIQLRWGTSSGNGLGGGEILGAPTLSQQLQEIGESEQRQIRELAWALGEIPLQMPQA
ncbi:autotransporter-associated beta strand repeat-containing protein [Pseudomonas sp. NFACC19-2]|nr:Ig-like domain-containing protein [Pseudomonas sp. NFACC19-2]SFW21889.1 autotransporter-associated beta strand repeat-containing protein [Pseudomonas sp. NFACC19-2]